MNIDWNQAQQGYSDELYKTANVVGDVGNWAANKARSAGNWAVDKAKSVVQAPIDAAKDMYNNSALGQAQNSLSNLGNVVGAVAPLGLAAMMSGGMGGGGARGSGNTYNYNYGNAGSKPSIFNQPKSGVGSLSSTNVYNGNQGMEATAELDEKSAGLVDTVAGVVRNRAINDIIDKSIASENPSATPEAAEKELEITSKYPEMTKLLEDEQNKAYLQKLLKN